MADPAPQLLDDSTATTTSEPADESVIEDVLVEEVSIDGMCGVY